MERVVAGEGAYAVPIMRRIQSVGLLVLLLAFSTSAIAKRRAAAHPSPNPTTAHADFYSVDFGEALVILGPDGVLANDTEAHGAPLTATLVTGPAHGALTLSPDGGFTYAHDGSEALTDSFTYAASNGTESSTAIASITILPPSPDATDDAYTTHESPFTAPAPGVLANDQVNGGAIAAYGATGAEQTTIGESTPTIAGGTVRLNADGSFTYTAGSGTTDQFVYLLGNGGGISPATVRITRAEPTADFVVTSPGFFYAFSGLSGQNPLLTLKRGRTYQFEVHTDSLHPIEILNAPAGSVTNNNISSGILTFAVPAAAQNYRYHCSIHEFGNAVNTVP
ncbi:MAG: hypothetical protein QOH21_991 [Acidobacteriota bacterium]|nr:hypothetical protein [Acidobacteriota bacterium]